LLSVHLEASIDRSSGAITFNLVASLCDSK